MDRRDVAACMLLLPLLSPCAPAPPGGAHPTARKGGPAPVDGSASPITEVGRVGNRDPRGVDHQPDYEGAAATLRTRMEPILTASPPPAQAAAACAVLLDAAVRRYELIEDTTARGRVLTALRSTRVDAERLCEAQTSVRAAACAAYLLTTERAELAWALDQCSRAFPRENARGLSAGRP